MKFVLLLISNFRQIICVALLSASFLSPAQADVTFSGHVFDLNGRPLAQAMVTVTRQAAKPGIAAVSVFTDDAGAFRFPQPFIDASVEELQIFASALGYEQVKTASEVSKRRRDRTVNATIILEHKANQAATVPASAWIQSIADEEKRAELIIRCVNCHQFPSPEVRNYARVVDDVAFGNPHDVREQSWATVTKYMALLLAKKFSKGSDEFRPLVVAQRLYSNTDVSSNTKIISQHFTDRMEVIKGYQYGAPLVVTKDTLIREYEVDQPNTIREALWVGDPKKLWAADVLSDNMIEVDIKTGEQNIFTVPTDVHMGPHTLVRGGDDSIWIAPVFNGVVAHLDPNTKDWETWTLRPKSGGYVSIHDLSYDYNHELMADKRGWIWFSDIVNNAVGYFDPKTGVSDILKVPDVPDRNNKIGRPYGLLMTSDQKYVWYTQYGIGVFGAFNVETMEFETSVVLPHDQSGPRRMTISDQDILYVALYGSGQLVEYDTKTRQIIGTYDLPDIASAPYATTWDNVRQIVWVATSNADVIYRFDPKDKSFGIIPLPREGAFLRMISVDYDTGALVSSYANISEAVKGPRMALIVDPGDNYQALKQQSQVSLNTEK